MAATYGGGAAAIFSAAAVLSGAALGDAAVGCGRCVRGAALGATAVVVRHGGILRERFENRIGILNFSCRHFDCGVRR